MKIFIILLSVFLMQSQAQADHFNCDLKLELLPDTDASELKQLVFDVDLKQGLKNNTIGSMNTTSCFGNFSEAFTSESSKVRTITIGDLTHGTFKDMNLKIGNYHYQLTLKFAQQTKSPDGAKSIDFIATGKMIPLDNDVFIHQLPRGECHLTKEQNLPMSFLSMPAERCK